MKKILFIIISIVVLSGCFKKDEEKSMFEKKVTRFTIEKVSAQTIGSRKYFVYNAEFTFNEIKLIKLYYGDYSTDQEGINPTYMGDNRAEYNNNILLTESIKSIDIYIEDFKGNHEIKKYELK